MTITTHFTAPQTLVMMLGPGSGIVKFKLSPNVSAYGCSPTTTMAYEKSFHFAKFARDAERIDLDGIVERLGVLLVERVQGFGGRSEAH
ncbi:hypothetical protein L3X38_036211 [Prunus dulcis]|uniref:Uncharacterized protein n=1 Tax=Prunus dulcis TaxID=3755 RepID=A0AAD4V2B7_PRUDU|nr:hypothetical protein L3X38_036211 [Prunus dulcis]